MQFRSSTRILLLVIGLVFFIGLLAFGNFEQKPVRADLSLKPNVNYTGIALAFPGSYPSE